MKHFQDLLRRFGIDPSLYSCSNLGNGLINDTFIARGPEGSPSYVVQRINNDIFTDVDALQDNIDKVTAHLRRKLEAKGCPDPDRHVLTFLKNVENGKSYVLHNGEYWRVSLFIDGSVTKNNLSPQAAYVVGKAFGDFENRLSDLDEPLAETIKDFHNLEFRLSQLKDALTQNKAGRRDNVLDLTAAIDRDSEMMTCAERLFREGKLQKRTCHCDTKLNNILFDKDDNILCVIDLDTVMPSFVFSDFGDFLRFAANDAEEDAEDLSRIDLNIDIFRNFTKGYLESATFLTPLEISMLPYAAKLFPYMQAIRFLTDYLNGDTYFKTQYPEHNLVRTKAQFRLYECARKKEGEMNRIIAELISEKGK